MTTEAIAPSGPKTAEALVARLFEAALGMTDILSVYLGDRLGLYRALWVGGPSSAGDLALRAGIDARYSQEWLEQQAATGILDVHDVGAAPGDRIYTLPEAYVDPLLNLDSSSSVTPLGRSIVACAKAMPALLDAYRTGGGIGWAAYGPDMIESEGDFNRPWLLNSLATSILPSIPVVHDRLIAEPPARVADVACGVGWAAIGIARGYPGVMVDGFDLDEPSIALALENAQRAGVADRVTFAVRDAADLAAPGQYDLAVIVEAVHDLSRPVDVLAAVRAMLRPRGTLLVADEQTEDSFTAPAGDLERLLYGFSILTCLPAAMTERPTAATGTVMRASTLAGYARAAGFTAFERIVDPTTDTLRFYLLTA